MDARVYELLNDQINKELYSSYLYLSFADYYEEEGLEGFANWYEIQAKEERDHALIFRNYLHENGCKVKLLAIDQPDKEFTTIRDESQNTALSEEVRAAKRTLAEEKLMLKRELEAKIRRFMELRQKQLDDQGRRMRKGIVDEIRGVVKIYARDRGVEIVLDSSGGSLNGVEIVLYNDSRVDVTDDIIKVLNASQSEKRT